MKKILILALCIGFHSVVMAQADTTPVYRRFPTIPVFTITKLADSGRFTRDDLEKKKNTLFIVFSPFCDHCKIETKALTDNIELFKDAQIIMTSALDFNYLKPFYEEYKIASFPNIIMGRDPGNYLGTFFNVQSVPAVFVYNKKGDFVKAFDSHATIQQIAEAL